MSVLYVEGFETSADQPDVTGRGLLSATSPVSVAGMGVLPVPSRTGVSGTGLMLRGPYGTSVALPNASAGVSDFGMLPLNQSIYSLWQAGGFSVGVNASFNSLNTLQIAAGSTYQLVYDGAQYYWALAYNGSQFVVAYSTDLKNWTVTATQPTTGFSASSKIWVFGSGSTATIMVTNVQTWWSYYSTNMGATWTQSPQMATEGAGYTIKNSSSTAPYISLSWTGSAGNGVMLYYQQSVSGAATRIGSIIVNAFVTGAATVEGYGRYLNDVIIFGALNYSTAFTTPIAINNTWWWCLDSTDPTNAANWAQSPASTLGQMHDICYFQPTGLWYSAGYGGIATSGQTGTASAPKGPSGTWTTVLATAGVAVWSIVTNGTIMVAVGQDPVNTWEGAIWTSTNGTTWTKANRFLLNSSVVANTNQIGNVIWDGSRFIITGALNNSFIATSPDGLAWTVVYATEYAEATGTACASFLGVFSGTQNPANGIFTPWGVAAGNVSGVGVVAAAAASNLRTVTAATITAGAFAATTQTSSVQALGATVGLAPPSTLSHYYELVFTAVPSTVNLFNVSWAIDNTVIGTLGQYQLAANTDTIGTAQLYLNLPRTGNFTQIDDIYLTNFTGPYHNNRLGIQRIYPLAPNSDVTDNFTTSIGGATNNKTVNSTLSNSEGYISSSATTAQDIYGTTNSVPTTGTVVNAVQVEGFMAALGQSAGGGAVGLQSNGVQKLSAPIATNNAPTRAQLIQETDPNTNVPWTIAGLNAMDIVVAKTS